MSGEVLGEASYGTETAVAGAGMLMNDATTCLSVLLADVSGSARLHEKLGGAEALRAVDRCLKRMERSVGASGGRIVKVIGDELMAVFASANEAFQSAIEMQLRVADLPPVSGVKLQIRIGFSYGPVSYKDGVAVGDTVNMAACLAGLAKPGQVLTSFQVRTLLSPALKRLTRDLGPVRIKDKSPEINVFEAIAPDAESLSPVASGGEAPEETSAEASRGARICLRYAGEVIILDGGKKTLEMGRDAGSDLLIHDRRASRNHARIDQRGDRIVLVDNSTNGTFVTLNGEPELFLRKGECVLHGKGVISFAASTTSPDADCAEFELL
jgi:adenylate cyclase